MQYNMEEQIKSMGKFRYLEEGEGEPLVLIHGLFGALSNFRDLFDHFKGANRVIIPMLPLFDLGLETGVVALTKYVQKFIEVRGLSEVHLMGNSLGGQVGS